VTCFNFFRAKWPNTFALLLTVIRKKKVVISVAMNFSGSGGVQAEERTLESDTQRDGTGIQ
jgi:hypothetical protein